MLVIQEVDWQSLLEQRAARHHELIALLAWAKVGIAFHGEHGMN